MSPALPIATSNGNNINSNGSPLLRSPRRVKRDSTSLKNLNNSCSDLMEDLRHQLSMPISPLLPDKDDDHSHRTRVVLSILDDDDEVEGEKKEDTDLDDSSRAAKSNSSDSSIVSGGLAARQLLLHNTTANSARQKSTWTENAQACPQSQEQQQKHGQMASRPSKSNPMSSDASVVSTQSIKSTRSLFSRLSRRTTPYQNEDSDDRTTATASSTKSWWKKRRERKKMNRTNSDKKMIKSTIFQSFRFKRTRNKGRNVQQQLVADFFDVQSVASEPDFIGSGMAHQARFGTANGKLSAGDRHHCPLEMRSVTTQNSRSNSFASFLLRLRQKGTDLGEYNDCDDDKASQGNNLIGNQIEAHESDSEYDDEITLGSGFENMSLADSLDGSVTASEANLEAAVADAIAAQQWHQKKPEERPLSSFEQPDPKPQSFLQRMLNVAGSPGDEIIRKAILAASSQPGQPQRDAPLKSHDANISLNSTLSETDSDDNAVKDERPILEDDLYNNGCNDQVQKKENAVIKPQKQKGLSVVMVAPVGGGISLMQGNMAKAKSEHCLELVSNISDIYEYQPPLGSRQGSDLINCSDTDDDDYEDDDKDAAVPTAENTAGIGSRWDSEASVASDTPLPKRPKRRITGQFPESESDDRNSESAQLKSLQQHHQARNGSKRQEHKVYSASDKTCPRSPAKPLASQSMRNLKKSEEEVDDESILSLLAGLLATWASEREVAAAEEVAIVVADDLNDCTVAASNNNDGLKSILKSSAASPLCSTTSMECKEEEEIGRGLRLSVTFDFVEIREYERVVGDNPSCARGPPVAIGWIYQSGTVCPVDDYETLLRGPRRTKREFHLTAEQRTQILVDEWECSEEDIRRARREATYIQYCRAKTSFSGSRVAAKEAAFLRKANERSKIQQKQHHAAVRTSGCGGTIAPPRTIPDSQSKLRRVYPQPATPMAPSLRDNRPNMRKTGRKALPPMGAISHIDRQNGSGDSTIECAYRKTRPVLSSSRPKTPPLSKYPRSASTLSSASSSTPPAPSEVPPTSRTLLEV